MSTLYIRLPSKAATGSAQNWPDIPCRFALVSQGNAIERQGILPLPGLSDTIARAQRVVLLLAAVDVTMLRMKVPKLSAARMNAALPNLIEDQLIADPSECAVVASGMSDGMRTIAVVQRNWLDTLGKTLIALGARQIVALPAQLCLPYLVGNTGQQGNVNVAINELGNTIDMTLRLSEYDGTGLAISADQNVSAAHEVIQTLCTVVPEAPIALYVPQSEMHTYQEAVNNCSTPNNRISILADSWSHWIPGASGTTLDLMAGLGSRIGPKLELRTWRWPLALAAALLFVNVAALNIDWWLMKAEASSLRATMIQIYKSAFPKETVIIDPVAQMQQKIMAAKHDAGLAAPDDFTSITAAFGEAWASNADVSARPPPIASLEYRDRSLLVRFKPNAEAPIQQMKVALTERNLSLDKETSGAAALWKIRSVK